MSIKMKFTDKQKLPLDDYTTSGVNRNGARSMIQAYHAHPKKLTISSGATLRGLKVSKDDLTALLNSSIGADEFMILFAVSQKDLGDNSIPDDEKSLTAILAPIKNNSYITSYTDSNGVDTDAMRNVFEPCPDKCNTTLEASYSSTFL